MGLKGMQRWRRVSPGGPNLTEKWPERGSPCLVIVIYPEGGRSPVETGAEGTLWTK